MSKNKKKIRDKSLNVRLNKEEILRLKLQAAVNGTSVSQLIRNLGA